MSDSKTTGRTIQTAGGAVYRVSRFSSTCAFPLRNTAGGDETLADQWDYETAKASGEVVDATLPRDDPRVLQAGAEWLEVYEMLQK